MCYDLNFFLINYWYIHNLFYWNNNINDPLLFSEDRNSCRSAPIPEKHRRYYDYISQWEPLSMNALIEYTQKKEAEGEGEFNQGRPKMWSTQVKVTWDQAYPNFFMTYFLMAVMYNVKYVVTSLLNLKLKIL